MSKIDSVVLILSGIGITGILASSLKNNFLSSILDSTNNRRNMFLGEGRHNPQPLLSPAPKPSTKISLSIKELPVKNTRTKIDDDVNNGALFSFANSAFLI